MSKFKKYMGFFFIIYTAVFMWILFVNISVNNSKNNSFHDEIFSYSINDSKYDEIDISKDVLPNIKSGDKVMITKKLNPYFHEDKILVFRTYNFVMDVYLSGKKIYSYGNNLNFDNDMIGRGFHFIKLKNIDLNDPMLVINMKTNEDMGYLWVDFFKSTESTQIWRDIMSKDMFSINVSIILTVIGFIGFWVLVVMSLILKKNNLYLLYSFQMAFFIGLWTSCTYGIVQMFSNSYELPAIIEYSSLYLATFFYISVIESIQNNVKFKNILNYTKNIFLIFMAISFFLNFSGIYRITKTVKIFRTIMVLIFLVLLYITIGDYKNKKTFEKLLSISNIISIILVSIHTLILSFDIMYISIFGNNFMIGNSITSLVALITVIAPILSYTLKISEIERYEIQTSLLKNIAYKDQLTGLENRYGGIAFIMELKQFKIPYFIVMYDLNNLKIINDKFGHTRGDKLITDFSSLLKEVFHDEDSINIRYGGDEFLTVVKSYTIEKLNFNLQKLQNLIDKMNETISDECQLSVAFGFAHSTEDKDGSYENILKIADYRMYQNKMHMKKTS